MEYNLKNNNKMKNIELKQLNYDELMELIENANLLLEPKKQVIERNC